MSDDIPTTKDEVDALVSRVPPPAQTEALITVAKGGKDPFRVNFLKWLAAVMFLAVILIAMQSQISAKNTNNSKAECRAQIAGELNIAKADGINAGNNYNSILGDALIAAINRQPVDPTIGDQLADARDLLRSTKDESEQAIQRQRDILKICR